jgi:hypothetical protein
MEISPVLNPQGMPVFLFGRSGIVHEQYQHRGLVVSLEWVREYMHRRNPPAAMCIWRQASPIIVNANENGERGTYVITRRAITQYVGFNAEGKCTGGFAADMLPEIVEALPILGFDRNDRHAAVALVDAIVKHAEHLHHMPVAPRHVRKQLDRAPFAEMHHVRGVKDRDGRLQGKTIDVKEI